MKRDECNKYFPKEKKNFFNDYTQNTKEKEKKKLEVLSFSTQENGGIASK